MAVSATAGFGLKLMRASSMQAGWQAGRQAGTGSARAEPALAGGVRTTFRAPPAAAVALLMVGAPGGLHGTHSPQQREVNTRPGTTHRPRAGCIRPTATPPGWAHAWHSRVWCMAFHVARNPRTAGLQGRNTPRGVSERGAGRSFANRVGCVGSERVCHARLVGARREAELLLQQQCGRTHMQRGR